MNKTITVFTPTYNRGYCLHKLYDSLCRQTTSSENFEWLVVDDGSTDNTENLIYRWRKTTSFKITYYKQKNEGKMAKLNFIHKVIETEFCMNVDSDDYLVDDALEKILVLCEKIKDDERIAGIVGLNIFESKEIVGTLFPEDNMLMKFSDFHKNGVKGDKKFIYKTNVIKEYPDYPSINGEKFPAPGYLYRLIDVNYDLLVSNQTFCVVEYMDDGLSKNKYKQFVNSPNSWAFYRKERVRLADNFPEKFRNSIHYVSSQIFARKSIFNGCHNIFLTILALPFGIGLNIYIRNTNKKGIIK